jgi:signal-transduction protein with cAMP-binding, CBS, and nucleotidyltransferase domain
VQCSLNYFVLTPVYFSTTSDSLKEAVEAKRPLTRAVLDTHISEAQNQLEDAVKRKAFAECGPLQDKLEELTRKLADLPTVDELREFVKSAEAAVALAAKNRDFAGAAAGQTRLDEARQRLADTLAAEEDGDDTDSPVDVKENVSYGFDSRAELEAAISDDTKQVKEAIHAKDFAKASSLQQALEEREALRQFFPSVEELTTELKQAKEQLDEAVTAKDFARAGALNEVVANLETKLEAEQQKASESSTESSPSRSAGIVIHGEEKSFESRGELENEIAAVSKQVFEAVAAKQFKKADELQAAVDKMVELREVLPSVAELRKQLGTEKQQMDKAIASRKFAMADELNLNIEKLEKRLEREKGFAPPTPEPVKEQKTNGVKRVSAPTVSSALLPRSTVKPATTPVPKKNKVSTFHADVRSPTMLRPVSKLRPAKPIIAMKGDSILAVTQVLARKRAAASIVVDDQGGLAGILTDTDVTRRVVAKNVDPATTDVSEVMTPNPTCVKLADSAMDALMVMVENRFRHLPVVDGEGSVVGLLDIAKCLNDAITKLEHSAEKNSSVADDAVRQAVSQQGATGAQAAALQAMLGNLMSQAFGNKTTPTLRSLLAGTPSTIVSPSASIRTAGMLMAESRKAALIVDGEGQLTGIFTMKDMMSRAVAKELPLDYTEVSQVMTPSPEVVSPDMTVLDALQMMHDHKFLTLPVCEDDGRVVGVVDVMDVIHGFGGVDGWRSMFGSAMDIEDDISEDSSVTGFSVGSKSKKSKAPVPGRSDKSVLTPLDEEAVQRPVSRLRPSKPITVMADESILATCQALKKKRGAASLIISSEGHLAGILTDTDVTRRVVAKNVDPATTGVSEVMTPNPTCVSMTDSATDALATMVENHFRHLPVVDDEGSVVGLLDIAKCLNDAITRLERSAEKNSSVAEDAVRQAVSQQGATGAQAAALQAMLGNLMSQAFGNKTTPTLRSLLAGKPSTIVSPSASIRTAGMLMADCRKAALVVDGEGQLTGIFTFKDMMSRAVATELPLDYTEVSEVMTPNPEVVSPDLTVLDALQMMHDHKFLNLPVCEDDGRVVGVVGVMDVIQGFGGAAGWRSMFSSAMELNDDQSDAGSLRSRDPSVRTEASRSVRTKNKEEKSVAKLRPSKPNLSISNEKILAVAQLLSRKRGAASLIVSTEGGLAGILTDTDVTRRVVAKNVDPATTDVSEVMTPNPTCVKLADSAMDALMVMVENRFRHLPVVDGEGSVVGLLDIAKCLNDAITKLEHSAEKNSSVADDAVRQAVSQQGATGAQAAALQAMLGNLMSQAFGNKTTPTLRSLLAGTPSTIVSPSASIRTAGMLMAESRKAALIVDGEGQLTGIFTMKDMMSRAVAKELPLDYTEVSQVMTPSPEVVSPDMTVLDALQMMHDHKFLTLPVCEDDGRVVGVVDVMDVIHGFGGVDGWRSMFSSAMDMDDVSVSHSAAPSRISATPSRISALPRKTDIKVVPETPFVSSFPNNIPSILEFEGKSMCDDEEWFNGSTIDDRGASKLNPDDMASVCGSVGGSGMGIFKVSDQSGSTHRVKCDLCAEDLLDGISKKLGIPRACFQVQFVDDEGDTVIVTSDDDVDEVWTLARSAGAKVAKLSVLAVKPKSPLDNPAVLGGVAVLGVTILAGVAFFLLRVKKA